jgi:hypothetical protein
VTPLLAYECDQPSTRTLASVLGFPSTPIEFHSIMNISQGRIGTACTLYRVHKAACSPQMCDWLGNHPARRVINCPTRQYARPKRVGQDD